VQLVADVTLALKAAERVNTFMMTAVRVRSTLVKLCNMHTIILITDARYR